MSIGVLTPWEHPEEWDLVTIAGIDVPGLAKVSGWKRSLTYDVKVGKGTAGATITLGGKPPAKGSITFRVWTTEQIQIWNDRVVPALKFVAHPTGNGTKPVPAPKGDAWGGATGSGSGSGGGGSINMPNTSTTPAKGEEPYAAPAQPKSLTKADALDIFHPALADIEVTSVLPPEELGQWEVDGDGSGFLTRTIEFLEFTQAGGNITATPNASTEAPKGDGFTAAAEANPNAPSGTGNASGSAKDAQGATVPKGFGGKK